ncbi:MAG: thioredoxin-dependent thiol peroxidase [Euryarchaeota archaeon]|nr:thioredoxin-dependent thiol peroxidase [Euryarchaeota archaeon]
MTTPGVGEKAPDFQSSDQDGKTWTLQDFQGESLVLYFYPKDDTPGCTREACGFRDLQAEFEELGARIVGVSPDDTDRHARFAEKHELPFTLLSDPDHETAEAYGVWKEKNMYGRKFWGIERTTFIIGPDGTIVKVYPRVKVNGHVEKVFEDVKGLVAAV